MTIHDATLFDDSQTTIRARTAAVHNALTGVLSEADDSADRASLARDALAAVELHYAYYSRD